MSFKTPSGCTSPWPARDAELTALWENGLSTKEIGRKMGLSKNSIVGRAHRLGLAKRESPLPKGYVRQRIKFTPIHACVWPIGHVGGPGFRFCGKVASPGKPYCKSHYAMASLTKRVSP